MDFCPLTPWASKLVGKLLKWNPRLNTRFFTSLFRFITITAWALVNVNLSITFLCHTYLYLPSETQGSR